MTPEQRSEVAALPKPTTGRVVVLVTALLAIGAYAGDTVHNAILGDQWLSAVETCLAATEAPGADAATAFASSTAFSECMAEAQRTRAAVMLAGGAAVAVLAVIAVYLAPGVVRRHRGLRDLPETLAPASARVAELGQDLALRALPALALGPTNQRDAFCFGAPGRPVLVLPPGLAVRFGRPAVFDPVVRHELAHVRHRDVPLAWLSRMFLWVGAVAAALPLLTLAGARPAEIADYVWRAALLVSAGWLVARAVLRAREHEADLAAAGADPAPLRAVLAGGVISATATGWRRWTAHHPSQSERVAVLDDPPSVARTGFLGGFLPAFFAGSAAPVLTTVLTTGLTGVTRQAESIAGAAALAGLVMAGSVGVDAWRASVVGAGARRDLLPDWRLAAGVATGVLLGDLTAPANAWFGAADASSWSQLIPPVVVAGATVLVGGLAAELARRRPDRLLPAWLVVLASALVFGFAFWVGFSVQILAPAGLAGVGLTLVFGLQGLTPVLVAGLVVLVALTALGAAARRALLVGLAGGTAGGFVVVLSRLASGQATTDAARIAVFYDVVDVVVLTVVAVGLTSAFLGGPRGLVAGVVAIPASVAACVGAFLALNVARGGSADVPFVRSLTDPGLIAGLALVVGLGTMALVTGESRSPHLGSSLLVSATAAALVAAMSTVAGPFLVRADLVAAPGSVGGGTDQSGSPTQRGPDFATAPAAPPPPSPVTGGGVTAAQYRDELAPLIDQQLVLATQQLDLLAGQPPAPHRAMIAAESRELLDSLAGRVSRIQTSDPAVARSNEVLTEAVAHLRSYADGVVEFHESGGTAPVQGTLQSRADADAAYQTWATAVAALPPG